MIKESDSMKERGEWIEKVSKQIQKRIFDMLEKRVEQNQWEYWENQFIPIEPNSIDATFQEVFVENGQKDLEEKFPNIYLEIYKRVFKGVAEELAKYSYKLGYTKHKESFGIGDVNSKLTEIGEKKGLVQKIKKLFEPSEVKSIAALGASENFQEEKEVKMQKEKKEKKKSKKKTEKTEKEKKAKDESEIKYSNPLTAYLCDPNSEEYDGDLWP